MTDALTLRRRATSRDFDPGTAILRLLGIVALPLLGLFALTLVAAIGAPGGARLARLPPRRLRLQGQQAQSAQPA